MAKLFALADPRVAAVVVKGDLVISEKNRDSEALSACSLMGTTDDDSYHDAISDEAR